MAQSCQINDEGAELQPESAAVLTDIVAKVLGVHVPADLTTTGSTTTH